MQLLFLFLAVCVEKNLLVTKKQSKQGYLALGGLCINCATKILVDQPSTDRIKRETSTANCVNCA